MTSSRKCFAGMATMPTRRHTLRAVLRSIVPQVDRLFLFLDRFPDSFMPSHPKITVLKSQDHGDLRANGKLLGLLHAPEPGIYFTVDDDICYPPDYVERMAGHLDQLGAGKVVGVHGNHLRREGFSSYLRDRVIHLRSYPLDEYKGVDVIATCTSAFRMEELRFDVRDWQITNMVDLHFSIECQKRNLARILVPRSSHWVSAIEFRQPDSIFTQLRKDDSVQTRIARQLIAMSPEG